MNIWGKSVSEMVIYCVIIITESVLQQAHSSFESEFLRDWDLVLPFHFPVSSGFL